MKEKISSLQMLRALAALSVCCMHVLDAKNWKGQADPHSIFFHVSRFINSFGGNGVDLFFCISGFIIYTTSIRKYPQPSITNSLDFLTGRFLRVYPLFWVTLLVMVLFSYRSPDLGSVGSARVLFLLTQSIPLQSPAWSLAFEVWFYLGMAFLLAITPARHLLKALMLWGSLHLSLLLLQTAETFSTSFYAFTQPQILEFFLGTLIAYLGTHTFLRPLLADKIIALFGSILLFAYGISLVYSRPLGGQLNNWERLFFAGLPSALLIYSLAGIERTKNLAAPYILTRLGDISFSVYLWQFPVMRLWLFISQRSALYRTLGIPAHALIDIATTLLVATISFYLLERPCMTFAHHLSNKNRNKLS